MKYYIYKCRYFPLKSRSREGAWIEIYIMEENALACVVAPARERGLKCAERAINKLYQLVAPARERGLKFYQRRYYICKKGSLPRGSVD